MTRYDFDGTEISDDRDESVDDRLDAILAQIDRLRADREERNQDDISLQQAVNQILSRQRLSPQALRELNYAINTSIEHEYGADISNLSLYNWDAGGEIEGSDVLFLEGYDRLVTKMAEGLTLNLQHIVQKIEYRDRVKITTDRGIFTADRAIITLPLGVLKSNAVEFSPALPPHKQQAIARLGTGILNKVYLKFPQAFWDEESDLLGYMAQQKGEWAEFLNLSKYTQKPILLGFNAGTYGAQIEGFSDTQIVQAGMTVLQKIYGQNIPDPEGWLMSRWQQDRFAQGSYSYIPKDASNDDRVALAEPVGDRLFFAGEATSSEYAATVHGALLSGRKAARQMVAA
jgi:monoamine oxidase